MPAPAAAVPVPVVGTLRAAVARAVVVAEPGERVGPGVVGPEEPVAAAAFAARR